MNADDYKKIIVELIKRIKGEGKNRERYKTAVV